MTSPAVEPRDFFDFDAWEAEHQQQPIRFHLFGRDWDLPGDVPAATMLKMQKLELIAETGVVPDGVDLADLSVEALVGDFVGADVLAEWLGMGIKQRTLQAIAGRLYALHNGARLNTDDTDEETPGDGDDVEPVEPGKAEA